MIMKSSTRKLALTAHVLTSIGWAGALTVFLAHAIAGEFAQDPQLVRAVCIAMGLTAWFVILPLSLASLVTGVIQALGTAWGLFRHYWVIAKLLLTAFATLILLLKLAPISDLAKAAATSTFTESDTSGLRLSLLVHSVGGLAVLLVITALAIYKPNGITSYGTRKYSITANSEVVNAMPKWVKVSGAIALIGTALLAMALLHGGHGPNIHG